MNFYKSAALALDHLDKHKGSVKGSIQAAGVHTASPLESKRLLALIIETLRYRSVLQELLSTVPILTLEKTTFPKKTPPHAPSSQNLLLLLLHDLLLSQKGRIEASDNWPPKQAVSKHQTRLKAELVKLQIREGKASKFDLAKTADETQAVRYVRWNPNVDLHRKEDWSLPALLEHLSSPPLAFTQLPKPTYPVPDRCFFFDPHLDDVLLAFGPNTKWWAVDKWYKAGAIILQDKASCFPAKIIMDGWSPNEGVCLDATAAPGNKTSYMSALTGGKGRITALEKSGSRYQTLKKMLERAECRNVDPRRQDFLDIKVDDVGFAQVSRILLDPSCSGSGIVNRLDYLVDDGEADNDFKNERLAKLADFQLRMILHAFAFPSARRIVYSTCSIHAEEDEDVVFKALQSDVAKRRGWRLAPRSMVLPSWKRRGRKEHFDGNQTLADSVIRCLPGEDKTNGFFVACFIRDCGVIPEVAVPSSSKRPHHDDVNEAQDDQDTAEEDADDEEEDEPRQQPRQPTKEKTSAQLARRKRKRSKQKHRT